jgi:hypothetical protein
MQGEQHRSGLKVLIDFLIDSSLRRTATRFALWPVIGSDLEKRLLQIWFASSVVSSLRKLTRVWLIWVLLVG